MEWSRTTYIILANFCKPRKTKQTLLKFLRHELSSPFAETRRSFSFVIRRQVLKFVAYLSFVLRLVTKTFLWKINKDKNKFTNRQQVCILITKFYAWLLVSALFICFICFGAGSRLSRKINFLSVSEAKNPGTKGIMHKFPKERI